MPDDLRPGVAVEVGATVAVAEHPPVVPVRVVLAEVAGGDPSSGFLGVPAAGPLVQQLPQVVVEGLEGPGRRPGPVVVRLAADDRIHGGDHLDRTGATQGA